MSKRTVPKVTRPRQFEVIAASTRVVRQIEVGGVTVPIRQHGTLVTDSGLARDIEQLHGQDKRAEFRDDVLVIPVDDRDPQRESGHRYSFSVPAMPWKEGKHGQDKK